MKFTQQLGHSLGLSLGDEPFLSCGTLVGRLRFPAAVGFAFSPATHVAIAAAAIAHAGFTMTVGATDSGHISNIVSERPIVDM